jgi:hypothetical protein
MVELREELKSAYDTEFASRLAPLEGLSKKEEESDGVRVEDGDVAKMID